MRRVLWPIGLKPVRVTPVAGINSLGYSESMTGKIQTVSQPYGRLRYQFDFPALRGQMAANFYGMMADLEDGANWVGIPCLFGPTMGYRDLGLQQPPANIPLSNGLPFSNGQYIQPSRPLAATTAAAALGARTVTIDVSNWNGVLWRGVDIGFMHFGAYKTQTVSIAGSVATVRLYVGLRKAVASGEYVTLNPVLACRLVPGSWSVGQRSGRFFEGASVQFSEVPDDVVRAQTV